MPATPKHQMRTIKQDKAAQDRRDDRARRLCVDAVWARTGNGEWGYCEGLEGKSCGNPVRRGAEFTLAGHVDEIRSKALGGSPHDPDNCRLLCRWCHFSGSSGAHRLTPNWRQGIV